MSPQDLPSLLLLPSPPSPAGRQVLHAAYRPPLAAAVAKLKRADRGSRLVVLLACPILHGPFRRHKTFSWAEAQSLVAGLYAVLAAVCAELDVATEVQGGPGSVDATVVLVDYRPGQGFPADFRPAVEPNNTAIVDLPTFASAYRPWDRLFHVRTEAGLALHAAYLRLYEGRQTLRQEQLVPVPGGLTMHVARSEASSSSSRAAAETGTETRRVVCLGGTFDHLHPGHKLLLTGGALLLRMPDSSAAAEPARFVVGVTGDEMLRSKQYAEYVEPWDTRARHVLRFLATLLDVSGAGAGGWSAVDEPRLAVRAEGGELEATFRDGTVAVRCVRIQDAFGPTVTEEDMDVLVVSGETRAGGQAVNDRRAERGWHPLEIYEVDVLDAGEMGDDTPSAKEDFSSKISSTAIRQRRAQAGR